jgi:(2Fe-2S) ferredoxin
MADEAVRLVVCVNQRLRMGQPSCAGSGSRELIEMIRSQLQQRLLEYPVEEQVCFGLCTEGPAMRIAPGGPFFTGVTQGDIERIIQQLEVFAAGDWKPDINQDA